MTKRVSNNKIIFKKKTIYFVKYFHKLKASKMFREGLKIKSMKVFG